MAVEIPDNIRTWTNEQLMDFGRNALGKEIRGSKTQLIDKIYALAGGQDNLPTDPAMPLSDPPQLSPDDIKVEDFHVTNYHAKYPHIKYFKDAFGRVFVADIPLLKTFDLDKSSMTPCDAPDYYIGGIGYHGADPRKPASE